VPDFSHFAHKQRRDKTACPSSRWEREKPCAKRGEGAGRGRGGGGGGTRGGGGGGATGGYVCYRFKLEPLVSKPDEQQVAPLWRLENSAYADTFKILLYFCARSLARFAFVSLSLPLHLSISLSPSLFLFFLSFLFLHPLCAQLSFIVPSPWTPADSRRRSEEFPLRKGSSIAINARRNHRARVHRFERSGAINREQ